MQGDGRVNMFPSTPVGLRRQHPPDASSESKSFKDFIIYLKAGFTIEYCIAKVVADYRLWRKEDKTPFEADLLLQYYKLFNRGDRHTYI